MKGALSENSAHLKNDEYESAYNFQWSHKRTKLKKPNLTVSGNGIYPSKSKYALRSYFHISSLKKRGQKGKIKEYSFHYSSVRPSTQMRYSNTQSSYMESQRQESPLVNKTSFKRPKSSLCSRRKSRCTHIEKLIQHVILHKS